MDSICVEGAEKSNFETEIYQLIDLQEKVDEETKEKCFQWNLIRNLQMNSQADLKSIMKSLRKFLKQFPNDSLAIELKKKLLKKKKNKKSTKKNDLNEEEENKANQSSCTSSPNHSDYT